MIMTNDEIVEICLTGLFKEEKLAEKLRLKGGQAIRLKENMKNRLSMDIDFSVSKDVGEPDPFFSLIQEALSNEFSKRDLHLFDFVKVRRPKYPSKDKPKFWGGWAVTFKLIEGSKKGLTTDKKRKEALLTEGSSSSKIKLDISEFEYCNTFDEISISHVNVKVYTRALLVLEKLRAICQQHPDYPHREVGTRARDYYDIEQLWGKVINADNIVAFTEDCKNHLTMVFEAKEVPLRLLDRIFDNDFLELQSKDWQQVKTTVENKVEEFGYYQETLKDIIERIK